MQLVWRLRYINKRLRLLLLLVVGMTNPNNKLKKLLETWALSDGPYKQVMLEQTRNYIANTSIAQLNIEIATIKSIKLLNLMSGASLPLGTRQTWLEQYQKLVKGKDWLKHA